MERDREVQGGNIGRGRRYREEWWEWEQERGKGKRGRESFRTNFWSLGEGDKLPRGKLQSDISIHI